MSDFSSDCTEREVVKVDPTRTIDSIEWYDGNIDECEYGCGNAPECYVEIGRVAFVACVDCLQWAKIHPIDNGHVDPADRPGGESA